eukprot:6201907-Pleurochrysis_carterae.AAC.1
MKQAWSQNELDRPQRRRRQTAMLTVVLHTLFAQQYMHVIPRRGFSTAVNITNASPVKLSNSLACAKTGHRATGLRAQRYERTGARAQLRDAGIDTDI